MQIIVVSDVQAHLPTLVVQNEATADDLKAPNVYKLNAAARFQAIGGVLRPVPEVQTILKENEIASDELPTRTNSQHAMMF
jgi:hypothetical protein